MSTPAENSAFHPGTNRQWAWDSTSLGTFKECPRKYYYTIIEQWVPRKAAIPLQFGIFMHTALEKYDHARAEGQAHEDATRSAIQWLLEATWIDGKPWDSGDDYRTRDILIRSIVWYLEEYKDDYAQTVVLANGKPAVELSFKFELNDEIVLCGHLDRVVEWQGSKWVMDRKTSKNAMGEYYFKQYSPDTQMSLYSVAAKVIFDVPVSGVIIDGIENKLEFTRFTRGFAHRSPTEIAEWLEDVPHWINMAHQMADADYFPMNDKSCHKYNGCPFRDVCTKPKSLRPNFLETDFVRRMWNPLEAR